MKTGSCLCNAVQFELHGLLRPSLACHCIQCRKTSGHYVSATSVPADQLQFTHSDGLKWYRSSAVAQRGFCRFCGSSLFWKPDGEDRYSVHSGVINGASGMKTSGHICTATKGDYYGLSDGLPQQEDC